MASRRDLKAFIEVPFEVHATSEQWVPPLRLERRMFLNRRRNAYFKHADAEYFLARRDGRVVGRVTAQIDRAFNEFHGNRWGMFGFLELVEDQEVARRVAGGRGRVAAARAAATGWSGRWTSRSTRRSAS